MTTIGINTLVYMDALRNGTPQSELLATIAAHGITLAEVRREYIADDAEYDAITNAAAQQHMTLFYSVPESITVNGEPNPQFEQYLDEAARMGARNVKFNQGDIKDVDATVLQRIDNQAAARNLTLSIENDQTPHNGTFACTQASLDHITANGSTIGYTFDLGNWYWRDENAQQTFNRLVDYITVFHLKNVNGSQDKSQLATTMLQDGVIDWQPMLDRLSASIPVFLEFPIPAEQVAEQVDIVRHAIAHS